MFEVWHQQRRAGCLGPPPGTCHQPDLLPAVRGPTNLGLQGRVAVAAAGPARGLGLCPPPLHSPQASVQPGASELLRREGRRRECERVVA